MTERDVPLPITDHFLLDACHMFFTVLFLNKKAMSAKCILGHCQNRSYNRFNYLLKRTRRSIGRREEP